MKVEIEKIRREVERMAYFDNADMHTIGTLLKVLDDIEDEEEERSRQTHED